MENTGKHMELETKAKFADRMSVNKSTVTRWHKNGRLVVAPNGLVKVEDSIDRIQATKAGRYDVEQRHAQQRGSTLPLSGAMAFLDADDTDMDLDGSLGGEMAAYKAKALESKNQMALLEVAISKGEMLHKADHHRDIAKLGAGIRQSIERLIDNLTPQLHGLGRQDVKNHINHAFNNLKDEIQ